MECAGEALNLLPCHRCNLPAVTTDAQGRAWCPTCARAQRDASAASLMTAIDALEQAGYAEDARHIRRRLCSLTGVPVAEMERLSYE